MISLRSPIQVQEVIVALKKLRSLKVVDTLQHTFNNFIQDTARIMEAGERVVRLHQLVCCSITEANCTLLEVLPVHNDEDEMHLVLIPLKYCVPGI